MPAIENRTVVNLWRGFGAFLRLDFGIARNIAVRAQGSPQAHESGKETEQRRRIEALQNQIAEKDRRLQAHREARLREQKQIEELIVESGVPFEGVVLPPTRLRFCGERYRDDEYFLSSGRSEAERLVEHFGLGWESRVLDVGSGQGRLAIGVLDRVGEIGGYRGIDVDERSIRWCEHHITREHPNFRFVHANVKNSRYNPSGTEIDSEFRLPFENGEFDIVYLYSVFSHMLEDDVREYLREFRRVLKPTGGIFLTGFMEDGVPDVVENPMDYKMQWNRPLHCVRYDRRFFEGLLSEYGFALEKFDHAAEDSGQSGLYVVKKGGKGGSLTKAGQVES